VIHALVNFIPSGTARFSAFYQGYLFTGNGIMDILGNISITFWSPNIWLPPNITWEDISPNADNKYANYQHLIYSLPMAVVLLGIRYAFER